MTRAAGSPFRLIFSFLLLCGWLLVAASFAMEAKAAQGGRDRINIVAAKLDYYDKEQKLVYSGNVVAVRGDATLRTPSLVVFLNPSSTSAATGSSNRVRRMEAAGPVTLVSKGQVATGDSGIYERAEDKVYLNGNVSLSQGPNVTKGDRIVYDIKTGQAVVTGHVRSMFIPNDESGSAKQSVETGVAGNAGPKVQ